MRVSGEEPTVLVVEDEPVVQRAIARALGAEGYRILVTGTAAGARAHVEAEAPDALVLDRRLPDGDGADLCAELRDRGCRRPILIVTARGDVADRVAGLDAGADDYLPKPFDVGELLARLRALLRRVEPEPERLAAGALELDVAGRRIRWAGGAPVELTHTESALLAVLIRHAGEAVARRDLFEQAWGYDYGPGGGTLAVYVGYLRRKLDAAGAPTTIRNVRGHGYGLDVR